jgi:hypothetical protein
MKLLTNIIELICKENIIYFKSILLWISYQCTICMKYLSLILILIE